MKIVIRSEKNNFTLYVPMFILSSGLRFTNYISKKISINTGRDEGEKFLEVIDNLDMDIILSALKELKGYKGLTLVEVKSNDGTYVLVKL